MSSSHPSKEFLQKLYTSGKSMMQITKETKYSDHTIRYWMNKYNIKRRSRSEAIYTRANPMGDPFKIKSKFSSKEMFLFGLGIGIFWGEGTKVSKGAVRVTNTNPRLLIKFREFLIKVCGVKPDKIQYALISFNDIPPQKMLTYWSKTLEVSKSRFGKITIIPKQGKGTYKNKSLNGVCTIIVNNIKLKSWIDKQLENL